MRAARIRIVLAAATLLAVVPGCATLPSDRPVAVLVRDAETGRPIAGAEVSIACPLIKSLTGPLLARATTEADGLARLHAAPCNDAVTLMQTEAPGYLGETKELAPDAVAAIQRLGFLRTARAPVNRTSPSIITQRRVRKSSSRCRSASAGRSRCGPRSPTRRQRQRRSDSAASAIRCRPGGTRSWWGRRSCDSSSRRTTAHAVRTACCSFAMPRIPRSASGGCEKKPMSTSFSSARKRNAKPPSTPTS